jgi:hypothetical protein
VVISRRRHRSNNRSIINPSLSRKTIKAKVKHQMKMIKYKIPSNRYSEASFAWQTAQVDIKAGLRL